MNTEKETQSTLMRGILILEKIMQAGKPLSSAYLAEELNLPKATVHRIAQQLEEQGLLQREPGGKRFAGGMRLKKLAQDTLSSAHFTAHRRVILQGLSRKVGETCNLTMLVEASVVYLDRVETNWPYRIHLPIGSRLPLHCTATGKLFLAYMPQGERQRLLQVAPLQRYTALTMIDPLLLQQQLDNIYATGVSRDRGEFLEGMISLAVPIVQNGKGVQMALAIHAPSARRTMLELEQYLPALMQAAAQMALAEQAMGADEVE